MAKGLQGRGAGGGLGGSSASGGASGDNGAGGGLAAAGGCGTAASHFLKVAVAGPLMVSSSWSLSPLAMYCTTILCSGLVVKTLVYVSSVTADCTDSDTQSMVSCAAAPPVHSVKVYTPLGTSM